MGGGSDGSWCAAIGIAQRQIPSRVAGEGELRWCFSSELRVRSRIVVVGPPMSEFDPGLGQRSEQRLVQFVSEAAIEAFDEGILRRLAGCDVMPGDAALIGPCQDGVAGQLFAVRACETH